MLNINIIKYFYKSFCCERCNNIMNLFFLRLKCIQKKNYASKSGNWSVKPNVSFDTRLNGKLIASEPFVMRIRQIPAHSIPFHSTARLLRRDPEHLISSAEVRSFSFLRQSLSSFFFFLPLFPAVFTIPSLVVRSIFMPCAKFNRTQITYRRFRFNIKSRRGGEGEMSRDRLQWRAI